MSKRIVLCADDYGQAPAISQGILNLTQGGRLSATSCLVNTRFWIEHATWLLPVADKIQVGLHFNLTEGEALSPHYQQTHGHQFYSVSQLLCRAFMRQLSQKAIIAECHAQLDRFEHAMGRLPDFIDGHQHSHQFPIVRHALLEVYAERLSHKQPYIRWVNPQFNLWEWKKLIIHLSGTRAFKGLLEQQGIPHPPTFSGVYSLEPNDYRGLFQGFLRESAAGGLIMCHPGLAPFDPLDSIAPARFAEYQYLASDAFLEDCQAQEVLI